MIIATSIFLVVISAASAAPELLDFGRKGHPTIVRNYVAKTYAQQLYHDLIDVSYPEEDEQVHRNLVAIHGDAGTDSDMTIQEGLQNLTSNSKHSVVFRVENLAGDIYDQSKEMIHDVAPNKVLEDGGTIHLYVSSPGASALGNHTDTTDIFVLHLDGEKEWLLCEEHEEDEDDPLTHKLSTCSTYEQREIDTLKCKTETLYPGDALFLPKRVVHSARAPVHGPSAHLTFGFANDDADICLEYSNTFELTSKTRRLSCNPGCDSSCDWFSSSCDNSCDNSDCDSSCNSGCDGVHWYLVGKDCDDDCDSGCDTCN